MASASDIKEDQGRGALGVKAWLGAMIGLTLLAGGAGGFLGIKMLPGGSPAPAAALKPAPEPLPGYAGDVTVRQLPPIIANLADPADAWLRLQASIVFEKKAVPKPEVLSSEIASDLLGYVKSLTLVQIGGASGLQHLREDLADRAQIRSDGKVRELIIEALVVQ